MPLSSAEKRQLEEGEAVEAMLHTSGWNIIARVIEERKTAALIKLVKVLKKEESLLPYQGEYRALDGLINEINGMVSTAKELRAHGASTVSRPR